MALSHPTGFALFIAATGYVFTLCARIERTRRAKLTPKQRDQEDWLEGEF